VLIHRERYIKHRLPTPQQCKKGAVEMEEGHRKRSPGERPAFKCPIHISSGRRKNVFFILYIFQLWLRQQLVLEAIGQQCEKAVENFCHTVVGGAAKPEN